MKIDEQETQAFDPYLGLAVAPSWWVLGRWTNRLRSAKDKPERMAVLQAWAREVWEGSDDCDPVRKARAVTSAALERFAGTVLSLLKAKYDGKPIADKVRRLIKTNEHAIRDDGRYLIIDEDAATFWSVEYALLFDELDSEAFEPPGWLNAVGICENERCGRFFVKQRIDNRFDSDKCRTNSANRAAYKRKHGRGH